VILYPAQVQGAAAAAEVAAGVRYFNQLPPCGGIGERSEPEGGCRPDVIIVARGGGALEDLLPFSEEIVVRAVADSAIPVISGVGHEPDWMLIDFAADVRAPTPTGAAEIVVPTKQSLADALEKFAAALKNNFVARINNAMQRLDDMRIKSPEQIITDHGTRLDDLLHSLQIGIRNKFEIEGQRLSHIGQMLESLSYKNVLRRGYAIVRHNGVIVSSKNDFALPAAIEFSDGTANV
jgi:exodeoxyribonuclease VII large subunit